MHESWIKTLDTLYHENARELVTYARSITQCPNLAEDAVHEAFAKLLKLQHVPDHPRNYIFRAVRNASIDCLKNSPPNTIHLSTLNDPSNLQSASQSNSTEEAETRQQLHAAINTLPTEQREVITLRLRINMPFREIATILNRPQGTVASQYRRSLETLRTTLEPDHA